MTHRRTFNAVSAGWALVLAASFKGQGHAQPLRAVWERTFGGADTDIATGLAPTRDSGYVLVGKNRSALPGNWQAWIVKADPAGRIVWEITFGGADRDYAYAVLEDGGGGHVGRRGEADHVPATMCGETPHPLILQMMIVAV